MTNNESSNSHCPIIGHIKTIMMVRQTQLTMYSDGSCEYVITCNVLDCFGEPCKAELRYAPKGVENLWAMAAHKYRPGSIYHVDGGFSFENQTLLLFYPDLTEAEDTSRWFQKADFFIDGSKTIQDKPITIFGSLKNIPIQKAELEQYVSISLEERNDYRLVIPPDLFKNNMSQILRGDYLEYCGMSQECLDCSDTGDSNFSDTIIIVNNISMPELTNITEDTDNG